MPYADTVRYYSIAERLVRIHGDDIFMARRDFYFPSKCLVLYTRRLIWVSPLLEERKVHSGVDLIEKRTSLNEI